MSTNCRMARFVAVRMFNVHRDQWGWFEGETIEVMKNFIAESLTKSWMKKSIQEDRDTKRFSGVCGRMAINIRIQMKIQVIHLF